MALCELVWVVSILSIYFGQPITFIFCGSTINVSCCLDQWSLLVRGLSVGIEEFGVWWLTIPYWDGLFWWHVDDWLLHYMVVSLPLCIAGLKTNQRGKRRGASAMILVVSRRNPFKREVSRPSSFSFTLALAVQVFGWCVGLIALIGFTGCTCEGVDKACLWLEGVTPLAVCCGCWESILAGF